VDNGRTFGGGGVIREIQLSICAVAALFAVWGLLSLAAWALRRGFRAMARRLELSNRAAFCWRLLGWRSAPCGCVWRFGRDPLTTTAYLACQGHAWDAPRIRKALASGTAHLGGVR
jgi:hypothetical protein